MKYHLSAENEDQIALCKSKLIAVDQALDQLDQVIADIEKNFSMTPGQFKKQAVKLVKNKVLL